MNMFASKYKHSQIKMLLVADVSITLPPPPLPGTYLSGKNSYKTGVGDVRWVHLEKVLSRSTYLGFATQRENRRRQPVASNT